MEIKKVKISDLKQGSIKHPNLPNEMIERIKAFKGILAEVEPSSLEETIDGFQRDLTPEKEVKIWELIAGVYRGYITEKSLTDLAVKKEVFSVILQVSTGAKENELQNIKLLNKEQIENIVYNCNPLLLNQII